jgi:hypothetical protein
MDYYYDYGYFDLTNKNNKLVLPEFNYGVFINIGFNYKINPQINASLQLGYDNYIQDISNNKFPYVISKNKTDYTSLIYSLSSIKKNGFNFSLGVYYNF